jgi:hypothetical protein
MRLATVLGAAFLATILALPAAAAPCKTPRQFKLKWEGGKGSIYFIAHGCALPSSCPVQTGQTAAKLPIQVSLRSGSTALFQTEITSCGDAAKCAARNSGGCKGGGDAIKSDAGLVKLSYLTKGVSSVMARVHGTMSRPPDTSGPLTIALTDAAGYTVEATFQKCRSAVRAASINLVCR